MNLIPISKKKVIKDGAETELFIVPAMSFTQVDGRIRTFPHPEGRETLTFQSYEDAVKSISLAGYDSISPQVTAYSKPNITENELVVNSLIELLKDRNNDVVASAALALGEIGDDKSVMPLVEILGVDDMNIRRNAIESLAKIGNPAIPVLIKALEDQNWVTRNSAAIALGEMSNFDMINLKTVIKPLISRLNDNQPIVKCSATVALGKICKKIKDQENKVKRVGMG